MENISLLMDVVDFRKTIQLLAAVLLLHCLYQLEFSQSHIINENSPMYQWV